MWANAVCTTFMEVRKTIPNRCCCWWVAQVLQRPGRTCRHIHALACGDCWVLAIQPQVLCCLVVLQQHTTHTPKQHAASTKQQAWSTGRPFHVCISHACMHCASTSPPFGPGHGRVLPHLVAPLVEALPSSRPAGTCPGLQGSSRVCGVLVGAHALQLAHHQQRRDIITISRKARAGIGRWDAVTALNAPWGLLVPQHIADSCHQPAVGTF